MDKNYFLITIAIGIGTGLFTMALAYLFQKPRNPIPEFENIPETTLKTKAPVANHRTVARRKGKFIDVDIFDGSNSQMAFKGWVLDRSSRGLRIAVEDSFQIGKKLIVRVKSPDNIFPTVEVLVRNKRKSVHGWELGCQFVGTPPWNALILFG